MTAHRRRLVPLVVGALAAAAFAAPAAGVATPTPPGDGWTSTFELASQDELRLAEAVAVAVARGGSVVGTAPGVALVELSPFDWPAVASVDEVELRVPLAVDIRPDRISAEVFGPTTGGAEAITLADAWHAAGIDGSGVRVGVIDFFDTKYWDVAEHGPLPQAGVNARCFHQGTDCTAEFTDGQDRGGEDHGVAVVEIIRDMAPGAEIYIGQATTLSDYQDLVDWFVSQGVRVVSRSLGSRYDGPGDGRGALNDIAADAVARGITWVNSGGNNGSGQYYRHPVRLFGDRVAFGPSGSDTYLNMNRCVALGGLRWANDWDVPAAARTDYDLIVWESPTGAPGSGQIVGRSERRQSAGAPPIEVIEGGYCPPAGRSLYLEVVWRGGDVTGDVLEILDYGDGFAAHTQTPSSAAVPIVDAALAGVVAVGAVDPPGSGVIGFYSSQGPTNDGRVAPALVAPSGFASATYGERFSGTSAAAPVVAGVAALYLDAGVAGDASGLGDLLRNSTADRGAPGPDNVYGHGEIRLPAPPPPAVASTPSRFVPLAAPTRFLDTRAESPVGPANLRGVTWPGEIRRLPVAGVNGVSPTATSVAVNLVTVRPDRRSYVQALPLWQAAVGGYSNLNTDAGGQNRANFAIIPVAADGTVALYGTAAGHLVVDVLGWFEPVTGPVRAGRFVELPTPQRLVDTRAGGAVASGTTIAVPNPTGVPMAEVGALVVTVTAVRPSSVGWLQAFPAGRPDVVGRTSTVNTSPGSNAASTAIVPVDGAGVAVHVFFGPGGSGHVVVDAIGYVTSAAAPSSPSGRYVPVEPVRAFDSRAAGGPLVDLQMVVVDASSTASVPADATAVMWNLTVVRATRLGFATGWANGAPPPATSSLNWSRPDETRAAAAVTAVSGATAQFRVDDQGDPASGALGHLLADVFGYFT